MPSLPDDLAPLWPASFLPTLDLNRPAMSLSVTDVESYAAGLGMPADLLPELARVMLTQLPGQLSSIESAIDARDAEAAFRAAHSYKGSVVTLTDGPLWRNARQLELLGRQLAPWSEIERTLTSLRQEHEGFLALLDQLANR